MIADAYKWASGEGTIPTEIKLASRLDRFGVQAVLGRQLYAHEVYRIEWSEKVIHWYNARKNTSDAAKFAAEHQDALLLLDFAEKLVNNG